jgi:hypothetical protein
MTKALPRSLLAPLVYVVALVLLIEEWCWDLGARLGAVLAARLARWPWVAAAEARVRALPPHGALGLFVLPGLILLPVKLLAVIAIARGHAAAGIATIAAAKLGGAAVVARLYTLTLPTLLAVRRFALCHAWFMRLKARCLGALRASAAARLAAGIRLRATRAARHRHRLLRVLRRFAWQWRARRRPSTRNLP